MEHSLSPEEPVATPLPDGYIDVPDGKIASVQTLLHMFAMPELRPDVAAPPWTLRAAGPVPSDWYLGVFRRVGEPWLWFSRLLMPDDELRAILDDPHVRIFTLRFDGADEGLLELDFRHEGECELRFLGLTAALIGTGAGRWLMNRALEIAWAQPISRFWLHSCNLDHPAALDFYKRSGFVPYARQIEIADDPRLTSVIRRDAAPHVPLIRHAPTERSAQ